jgi:hypothetical protein
VRLRLLPALAALVLGAATALLVACGGDGRIPSGDASSIKSALSRIESDYRAGRCQTAEQDVEKVQNALLNLPNSVNDDLRNRLQSGIRNLRERVPATCGQAQTQTQETQPETTTTDTTTTETTTTDTETTSTETTGTETGTTGTETTGTGTDTGTTGTDTTTTGTDNGTGGAGGETSP